MTTPHRSHTGGKPVTDLTVARVTHRGALLLRADVLGVPAATMTDPAVQHRVLTDADGAPLSLRAAADGDEGTFDGYACVWDVTDAYGTRFRRGTFVNGGLDGDPYALLWMHDPTKVLGLFYAAEDDHGLHITGRWDDTPEGQTARARARSGSAPGLSVGFVPVMVDPDDSDTFTSARLVETSQITARMAAVPGASLIGARGTGTPAPGHARDELRRAAAILALNPVHRP